MLGYKDIIKNKKELILNGFFFLFIGIILVNQIRLFLSINVDYIDNDQVVMWSGARHFYNGLFYVPRYYGQDYNTMMEALFAVPFMWMGVAIYYAVPLATHLIFLTPFLFIAIYLFIKKQIEKALCALMILLAMPTGYDIMNSIPRGFVTGLFFTSLLIVSLYHTKNYKLILLNTFLSYVGYLVNPNSVLVSCPILFYLFLYNYKNIKYYVYSAIGLLIALPIDYGLNHFYKTHPNYILYGFSNSFSFDYFMDAIKHINSRFAHVGLFMEEFSIITFVALIVLGIFSYQKNKKWFYSYLIFLSIIIISFFSSKAQDGIVWPFFSYSRLYLGIPIFLAFSLFVLPIKFSNWFYALILVVLLFSVYKQIKFKNAVDYHVQEKRWEHVHLTSLKDILQTLNTYKTFCNEQGVDNLIMVNPVWRDDIINYAGPAVFDDYPNTFKPSFERRSWRIEEETGAIHTKFVIYTANYDFDKLLAETRPDIHIKRLDDWGCFLVYDNGLTTVDFIKHIGAKTDGF